MYLLIHTCMDQIVLKVFLPTALFLRLSDLDQEKEKLNGIQTDQPLAVVVSCLLPGVVRDEISVNCSLICVRRERI